MLLIYIHIYSW